LSKRILHSAHIVRVTISLFLTYLLGPIPRDMQLFIQAVRAVFFIVGGALNGTATEQGWIETKGMLEKLTHPLSKISGYATVL